MQLSFHKWSGENCVTLCIEIGELLGWAAAAGPDLEHLAG